MLSRYANEIRDNAISLIGQYNAALREKNMDAVNRLENDIREAEAAFANQSQDDLFSECKKSENPILEGVRKYEYPVLKHRLNREDGIATDMELVEDRTKQIDLVKLCKFCDLSTLWAYKVERMGELLCVRAAKELGMTTDEIKKISKTYRMDKAAREVELGGTPTSNNQICKLLQTVIDDILFEDDGSGKNKYKCNSHDVAYLLMCYTKRGRKQLSVTVAKASFLHGLVVDVLHRIVCGLKYGLEYQMIREDKAEPAKAKVSESKQVSESKSEPASDTIVVDRPAPAEEVAA